MPGIRLDGIGDRRVTENSAALQGILREVSVQLCSVVALDAGAFVSGPHARMMTVITLQRGSAEQHVWRVFVFDILVTHANEEQRTPLEKKAT